MYAVVKLYQDFYNKPCLLINKCDISMQNIRAYICGYMGTKYDMYPLYCILDIIT